MSWIEAHGHGGDLLTAASIFKREVATFLDFSANMNPLGPPQRVMERMKNELSNIIHYPDPSHRKLKKKLAERLSIATEQLLIGNGAAECLSLVFLALQPKVVGVVHPCFSEYEQLARAYGASIVSCRADAKENYKPKLAQLFKLCRLSDIICMGHPNNPNGIAYTKEELIEVVQYAAKTKTYVIIDEAFLDFVLGGEQLTLLPSIHMYPHVIIVRSMTKFYAIPGLRLGYTAAHPDLICRMQQKQVTWSVNQLALLAGEACLDEELYEKQTIELIQEQRGYLLQELRALGFYVFPGQANFLLVRLSHEKTAADLQWELGKKGILIRSCAMYPGLTAKDFRIAVRLNEENETLLRALQEVMEG